MLQFLAAAGMIGGSLLGGFGALGAGKRAYKEGKRQREEYYGRARTVERIGGERQERLLDEQESFMGTQKAQFAKSGVGSQGTPSLVEKATALQFQKDIKAMGEDTTAEAQFMRTQGDIAYKAGKRRKKASKWQFASSLLTGGANFAKTFTFENEAGEKGLFFR